MKYGGIEFFYAEPFANSLVADERFRVWVLQKTKFSGLATDARLLNEEMFTKRGKQTATWWRSHFTEKCRCEGCSGKETDILAIFETTFGRRFSIHVEVKQPKDVFRLPQSAAYPVRATCWVKSAPNAIISHNDACTLLLCSQSSLKAAAEHLRYFDSVITFEEIADQFPEATYIP